MKRCIRCVLPETFPGIHFDDEGVCQYCRRAPATGAQAERRAAQKARLRARFEELVAEVRDRARLSLSDELERRQGQHLHAAGCSTQQYDLRILAFTFDNGFVSPARWTTCEWSPKSWAWITSS